MRYWTLTLLGAVIIAGSVVLSAYGMYLLLHAGTCSDGGAPRAVPNPCPEHFGTATSGMLLGIFVLPFVGMALLARRQGRGGGPAGGTGSAWGVGVLWFLLLFTCMGAAALVGGLGPAAVDEGGSASGAAWAGGTFLAIGAPALLLLGLASLRRPRARPASPARGQARGAAPGVPAGMTILAQRLQAVADRRAAAATPVPSADAHAEADPELALLERLEKLDGLRTAGLVTETEFAARRQALLDEA